MGQTERKKSDLKPQRHTGEIMLGVGGGGGEWSRGGNSAVDKHPFQEGVEILLIA